MKNELNFKAPEGWKFELRSEIDEIGSDMLHLEADSAMGTIEAYLSDMPEGDTAEDQAFANYVEMVGFDDDASEEDENVIQQFSFNGKKAYGFASYDENDKPVRVFAQEVKKGIVMVICISSDSWESLNEVQDIAERGIRIK